MSLVNKITLDEEGYAECPDCGTRIHCGTVGLQNLEKRHRGSKICLESKAKRDKNANLKKNGTLLNFFKKPKPSLVPSTIPSVPLVQSPALPRERAPDSDTVATPGDAPIPPNTPLIISHFIEKLSNLTKNLPDTIPEASDSDKLAEFGQDPANFDDKTFNKDDLWEEEINPRLKRVLGWGTEGNMKDLIRRGRKGVEGLANYARYFVEERGVDERLFEGKLSHFVIALEELVNKTPEPQPNRLEARKILTPIIDLTMAPEPDEQSEIITNSFEFEDSLGTINTSANLCKGYVLVYSDGKSPHTSYPFALHDTLVLPWDYALRNGVMALFSRACLVFVDESEQSCRPCQLLRENKTLEKILARIDEGVHENAGYAYYGFSALSEVLHRRTQQLRISELRGLNQAKKLLSKATVLSDQKRLLMAIASGNVNRVDRILSIGLHQNKGVRGLLASYVAAAEGHYHPKSFTEEEDMKGSLLWKLGGTRVAQINHRANGTPSVSYLRTRSIVPHIVPSHNSPTTQEVQTNVDASLHSVLDVVHSHINLNVLHTVLMFDEIAAEKRIRWDPKTNFFLGVCRQHASRTSMEFINEGDMEELFRCLDEGVVHYAAEATVAALGILCKDNRIYPGRPVLVSGDCKRETGEEHAGVIQTVLNGVNNLKETTRLRVVSIASDGESRRGAAFILLTFKHQLSPNSPIYPLLKPLTFLNLHVGDDDLTCDKDWKHVFKRFRNLLLRHRGVVINGFRIKPGILKDHFKSSGLSGEHVRALFNPEDQQDVKMAFDMLKDIWSLPRISDNPHPGFQKAREAVWILGKLLYHMVFPYLCVDLSLSEQIEHLSAAAHLTLALYRSAKKDFIPTNLYIDLMLMIKNVLFCVAKAKIDDLEGELWIILLGTDRLEELFGILRTMVGNDTNLDILQLVCRLAGTTEVSNILAKYPHWDQAPRRLKLPALTRESKEIPDSADHIKPSSWRGNVKVKDVSLQTSWNRGRRLVEDECAFVESILTEIEGTPGADLLAPFGVLLFDTHSAEDDIDESLEDVFPSTSPSHSSQPTNINAGRNNSIEELDRDTRVEIEDTLQELAASETMVVAQPQTEISRTIIINGNEIPKSRALARYSKFRKHAGSTDRLKRVQDIRRYVTKNLDTHIGESLSPADETEVLIISDPIATLLHSEKCFWLCIGEVNDIKIDGNPAEFVPVEMLNEDTVTISYQMLGVRPATSDDDPGQQHDWRTYAIHERSFTVPGHLIQVVNPTISVTHTNVPFYLFQSSVLVALTASIFRGLMASHLKNVPKIAPSHEYPYCETSGRACFVCETHQEVEENGTSSCPRCSPTVTLDLSQGQRVLEHIGAHILHDPGLTQSTELCGLCLRPPPFCQFFLMKGKGANGSLKINQTLSRGCLMKVKYSYRVAAESSPSSPCSNVPIACPLCSKTAPAIWKYFMKAHVQETHKSAPISKYKYLWKLSNFEVAEMKKIWAKRKNVVVKSIKKSKNPPLVVSENHRAHIPVSHTESSAIDSDEDLDSDDGLIYSDGKLEGARMEENLNDSEGEDQQEVYESTFENPMLNAEALSPINKDIQVDMTMEATAPASVTNESIMNITEHEENVVLLNHESINMERSSPSPREIISESESTSLLVSQAVTEIQRAGTESETSGRGRRKRAPRQFGDLNSCLCGTAVNLSVDSNGAIECRQLGCETRWYHLQCIGLEQAPTKWICEACEASGSARAKRPRK